MKKLREVPVNNAIKDILGFAVPYKLVRNMVRQSMTGPVYTCTSRKDGNIAYIQTDTMGRELFMLPTGETVNIDDAMRFFKQVKVKKDDKDLRK